jgi:hypothetical protein
VLVGNKTGATRLSGPIIDMEESAFDELLAINLKGPLVVNPRGASCYDLCQTRWRQRQHIILSLHRRDCWHLGLLGR